MVLRHRENAAGHGPALPGKIPAATPGERCARPASAVVEGLDAHRGAQAGQVSRAAHADVAGFARQQVQQVVIQLYLQRTEIDPRRTHQCNWTPFIPANEGPGKYGMEGVLRGAAMVFFAYIGFEAVSVAAQESHRPQRDMPIGMMFSLVICTVITGIGIALLAALFPLDILGELTSMGTLIAFAAVCAGVLILRRTQPDLPRPFRIPMAWLVCSLGVISCLALLSAMTMHNWMLMAVWTAGGFIIYFAYGYRHSRLRGK